MDSPVVKFRNVSKTYSLYKKRSDKLLEILSFRKNGKTFSALSNLSFEVFKGETIGIIGVNGSGKSTLSNVLAQVTPQSSGDIYIDGETSLVAISAGLNNQLSGLENIELKCLMHGLNKRKIKEITPSIIDFADIGDFINQPIKSYSSGMKSRLGFAISAHIQPDILVVDEALSVGDSTFYQKCLDKFDEFKEQGKTIFFISHSLSQVKAISDRILWLNFGRVEMFDEKTVVAKEYTKFIKWFNQLNKQDQKKYRKKMLSNQMATGKGLPNTEEAIGLSRRHIKRKPKNSNALFVQISLLVILFLVSALLMFIDNPLAAVKSFSETNDNDAHIEVNTNEPSQSPTLDVNKTGYTAEEEVTVFKDNNLDQEIMQLPFAKEVSVLEKIDGFLYKVRFDGKEGYIKETDIEIVADTDMDDSNVALEDFLPIFPEQFRESYSFLFLFLNTEYEMVKSKLQGLTGEYNDNLGRPVLDYESTHISYIFDDNQTSVAIEVKDIVMEENLLERLRDESIVISNDSQLYYVLTSEYQCYIDIKNSTVIFEVR
ncbi:ABC transporter-related protein [Oceanobacillus picturae]|uniref:ABC transporter-related protein n=1 Tax=Oceanobacillus picturae TaxID=171693 RepID=A0A0U9HCR5_9BACI|nr:ATP-binding cassette domain-containing protein [Oceanobacillus picturae]GAQ16780.1 ABC transporter-related protein [Oceanobacillus picturae]